MLRQSNLSCLQDANKIKSHERRRSRLRVYRTTKFEDGKASDSIPVIVKDAKARPASKEELQKMETNCQ